MSTKIKHVEGLRASFVWMLVHIAVSILLGSWICFWLSGGHFIAESHFFDVVDLAIRRPLSALVWGVFVFLAILLARFYWRKWRLLHSKKVRLSGNKHSYATLLIDAPIETPEEDFLGFSRLAEQWSKSILVKPDAKSLVFALTEPWGTGKSSMINLVAHFVGQRGDDPIIVRYNPWYFTDSKQILESFISTLFRQIEEEVDGSESLRIGQIEKNIKDALLLWSPDSYLSRVARSISQISDGEQETLETSLDEAESIVSIIGRPMLFVIDDMDRLDERSLSACLMALRLIGNIRGVTYLVAISSDHAATLLKEYGGTNFLAKIYQKQLILPKLSRARLDYWVKSVLSGMGFSSDEETADIVAEELVNIGVRDNNPRSIIRLINDAVSRAADSGLDFTDVLKMSLIADLSGDLYRDIKNNPQEYATDFSGYLAAQTENYIAALTLSGSPVEDERAVLDKKLALVAEERRERAEALLRGLFPGGLIKEDFPVEDVIGSTRGQLRIYNNLLRYLTFGDSGETFDPLDAEALFESPSVRIGLIEDFREQGRLEGFLQFAIYESRPGSSLSVVEPIEFFELLQEIESELRDKVSLLEEVTILIMASFRLAESNEHAENLLESLVTKGTNHSVIERVLINLAQTAGIWRSGFYSPEDITGTNVEDYQIGTDYFIKKISDWCQRAVEHFVDCRCLFETESNPMSILYRIGQFSQDYSQSQHVFAAQFPLDGEGAEKDALIKLATWHRNSSLEAIGKLIPSDLTLRLRDALEDEELVEKISSIKREFVDEFLAATRSVDTDED